MSDDFDQLDRYDYQLPRDLIAQHPLAQRTDARLLLVNRKTGELEHHHVRDLPSILEMGDLVVVNDTKVVPARLLGYRTTTGGRWEGLYLRSTENGLLEVLGKTRGSMQPGESITLRDRDGRESQQLVLCAAPTEGHFLMRPEPAVPVEELLQSYGRVPLPPYIRDGLMVDSDEETYQTIYARTAGSVAAPTAGLHFTAELIQQLRARGKSLASVTLHVGLGTFQPIKSERLSDHPMHTEQAELSEAVAKKIEATRAAKQRVVAVGTTTVRTLETVASLHQGKMVPWKGETNLFIRPPYKFQAIDAMLTNFHLPKSTLMVLVSTFAGHELIMNAYREAIEQRYRFYSYGDCMLIV